MNIKIQANTISIPTKEILNNISKDVLNEIKNNGVEHPYFQAYSIVHEGISRPNVIGEGIRPIKWLRETVENVTGVVKKGLQFFIGHNKDNSTDNRKSIGEVVTDFKKTIGDTLHHIVVGYFPNRSEAELYDVCSIEADVKMKDYEDMSIAEKIEKITGIALGNSNKDRPAFHSAVRLGAIQCFESLEEKDKPENIQDKKAEEIHMEKNITFHDIKKAVSDMNIFASQLFTKDDLKKDNGFNELFDKMQDTVNSESNFKKQLEEKDKRISELEREKMVITSKDRLNTFFPEGLTEKQKVFIEKRFNPDSMEDLSDDKIKEFISKSQEEYKEYAGIFGVEKNDDAEPNDPDKENNSDDPVDSVVNDILK